MTEAVGARGLLRIPDFRRLFVAQAVSDVGDGMTYLALYLAVLNLTGSTALIALMSILVAVPPVTVGLLAGAWADRADRRRIMLASDTARAVLVAAMVPFATRDGIPVLFALAFLQSVVGTFFSPARGALVPKVVPEAALLTANSLGQSARMIATVTGSTITGVVAAATGTVWPVFLVDAASFIFSVAIVLRVTRAAGAPDAAAAARIRASGMGSAVLAGLRVVRRSPQLVAAIGGVGVMMLGASASNVLYVPFLVKELGGSPALLGPIDAAQVLAMVIAGGLVASLGARVHVSALVVVGLAGIGVCIGLMGLAPAPWALLVLVFALGWFVTPLNAATSTIVVQATTDATRGRVLSAMNAVVQTTSIVGMAAAGVLASVVGIRAVLGASGIVAVAAAGVAWVLFRSAQAAADPDVAAAAALENA